MLVVICPKCESYLVEHGKQGKIDCIKCGLEFTSFQQEKYIPMNQLYEILKKIFYQKEVEKALIKHKPQHFVKKNQLLSFTKQNNLKMINELRKQLIEREEKANENEKY